MDQSIILSNLFNVAELQSQLSWQPFREGVEIFPLYESGADGSAAALLRYQPGAAVPQHEHGGFEHILVLAGSQSDQKGTYEAGTLIINPPLSRHRVTSEFGCIVFVVWERPIQLCP
ncbi:MAG: cupin domain-containing protein [Thermosynechococcaceae cyanobacterium MS004]|nr:cupin domain-containing protein [Thermosynechococcaceae cyanobacterium MS004]